MDVLDTIKYAREYLYKGIFQPKPFGKYVLNRKLQYLLCQAFERLEKEFGEITKRDVVRLVEAWIMSQGTAPGSEEPLIIHYMAVGSEED